MFPATLDSVMRLAGGRSDSPMLMALQLTTRPIGIAATFPGMNEVIQEQIGRLPRRPNVVFSGEVPAFSVSKEIGRARLDSFFLRCSRQWNLWSQRPRTSCLLGFVAV
jgi:hypothetical protein